MYNLICMASYALTEIQNGTKENNRSKKWIYSVFFNFSAAWHSSFTV